MDLIEAILTGIHIRGLQKPIVFFSMLIGLVLFGVLGILMLAIPIETIALGKGVDSGRILLCIGIAAILFALATTCGYFIKRCFDKDAT